MSEEECHNTEMSKKNTIPMMPKKNVMTNENS